MPDILTDPVARLLEMLQHPAPRVLIALAGFPGSGKSTVCEGWATEINRIKGPGTLTVLGMDGFHLSKAQLRAMENPDEAMARRGAPYTFDPEGLIEAVGALKTEAGKDRVGWPGFDHGVGDPEPDAVFVDPSSKLILVEGIYTLKNDGLWAGLAELFDERWFLDVHLDTAMERVAGRHMRAWGLSPEEARQRADSNDRLNCDHIIPGRRIADFLVENPGFSS